MEKNSVKKQTLKTSLERLNQRNYQLNTLTNLSSNLLNKFLNPKNEPIKEETKVPITEEDPKNLIELFNDISENIGNNINIISMNLERILEMID